MPQRVIRVCVLACSVLLALTRVPTLHALEDCRARADSTNARALRDSSGAMVPPLSVTSRGIRFTSPDTCTSLTLRARIQNLAEISTVSTENLAASEISMAPRRVRLRLDGTVLDPRLSFRLQLSFSRRDQDFDESQAANVVRDAVAYWRFNPSFQVGFGQTKLPGNRQRVVSSGELQFAERSIVNNRFTFDRDQGLFARLDRPLGRAHVNVQYAISLGEGRNQPPQKSGIAHTARVEFLPLGNFTDGGDYFEGDILGERSPKLSFGASYGTNSRAARTGGQLGTALWDARSFSTVYVDGVFKYRGFAAYSEFASRFADEPITRREGSPNRYIFTGSGRLVQASYFLSNWEPAVRYAQTSPHRAIQGQIGAVVQEQKSIGITRYFNRHRIRLQGEVTHNATQDPSTRIRARNFLFRLNSEVGI